MSASVLRFSITLLGALAPTAKASCSLQNLEDAATAYLSSVTVGTPSAAFYKAAYHEKNRAVDITKTSSAKP
jgi:hypothetical protein